MPDADFSRLERTVNEIYKQTRETNGRVTALEADVKMHRRDYYGDPNLGVVGDRLRNKEMRDVVRDARAVVRVAKWAVVATPLLAFVGAAIASGSGL